MKKKKEKNLYIRKKSETCNVGFNRSMCHVYQVKKKKNAQYKQLNKGGKK